MTEVFQVNFLASEMEHSKSLQQVTIVTLIPQVLKRVDMFFISICTVTLAYRIKQRSYSKKTHLEMKA